MPFFSRKCGEQVLAKGSKREKQNKRAMQLPLNAFLHFGQICYLNSNQRARCFGWSSTRLCQFHSTPQLQNSSLVFTDAILSKSLPMAHSAPFCLCCSHGHSCTHHPATPFPLPLHDTHYGQSLMRIRMPRIVFFEMNLAHSLEKVNMGLLAPSPTWKP